MEREHSPKPFGQAAELRSAWTAEGGCPYVGSANFRYLRHFLAVV
jgi:hypothetical protein